jgi:nifR3 family TIM-barrel protein
MDNFWAKLKKPFTVLAPMENVTDYVFREIVCDLAKPDVLFTEFTSAHGLASPGRDTVAQKLKFSPRQKPIVAQIWGSQPDNMGEAAKLVRELGFDGVDINLGCPDRNVMKKSAGAGLIGNYDIVEKMIASVKKGAKGIPVSVKTRMRHKEVTTEEWIGFLLKQDLAVLTVHGRTPEQQSLGAADWDEIGRIVEMRNRISPKTLIIGNGDVKSYAEVLDKHKKYKVDGVMIGRGIFSNPWVFEKELTSVERPRGEYVTILLSHLDLFEKTWGKRRNFAVLKKFFKMYVRSFDGANELRDKLMKTEESAEVREILKNLL